MKKRTKTIEEIFREGKALDAAVRRAVRQAMRENEALDRVRGVKKPRRSRSAGRARRRAA